MFVDDDLAGEKCISHSHTEVFIFTSKVPIHWYIKTQTTFEASNFGVYLGSMKTDVNMVEYLGYKIQMFRVSHDEGQNIYRL